MCRALIVILFASLAGADGSLRTVPTFTGSFASGGKPYSYTIAGNRPELGGTTEIPTVLVPLSLTFAARGGSEGQPGATLNADRIVPKIVGSPIFQKTDFATGRTQYPDAVQRAAFFATAVKSNWHTLLGHPRVTAALHIQVPVAKGYLLHSRRSGQSLAVADLDFVQKELVAQLGTVNAQPHQLLIAVARNVEFYSLGDATVCCSVGTHGAQLDPGGKSAQTFVIGSYFDREVEPRYADVQGLSQQIAEWMNDPLRGVRTNEFPRWLTPSAEGGCGGNGASSAYLLEQPTDLLPGGGAFPVSSHKEIFHLANVALLPWFAQSAEPQSFGGAYSFPDTKSLPKSAQPCPERQNRETKPTAKPLPQIRTASGHALIGYWEGYASVRDPTPLRDVSPQWDIVIATFAAPVKGSTSLLEFEPPAALGEQRMRADIAHLKARGKRVLISLGGGGQVVTLNTEAERDQFVASVTGIVEKYQFDGVDLDIETPSILIEPGDTDFRHPKTPSVVYLIEAMHRLREHFGPDFMIAEVPEAAQAQAGMVAYGGQFGSFLPVIYGTRDILSFVDAQDYNTPPLEGLDGNYYFPGNADYHVALAEMLVRGFPVGESGLVFPPLPPEKVAIGLPATPTSARNYTEPAAIEDALRYLIGGKEFTAARYKLQRPSGYPKFLGAMFWAINEDRRNNYRMSNTVGPFLHREANRARAARIARR